MYSQTIAAIQPRSYIQLLYEYCIGATLGFNQSVYVISENDGSVDICVDLEGQLQRDILAEVFILQSSASGNNASAVIDIFTLYLSNLCM